MCKINECLFLTPNEQFSSYIHTEQATFDKMMMSALY
jgi:hypothetical protein